MGEFNQDEYNKFLIENGIIGFFAEGKNLKSGRFSYWYANCRRLADTVGAVDKTADFLIAFLQEKGLEYDYIYGVPEGVTKLAGIIDYKRGIAAGDPNQRLVMGRGKPKEHGDPKDKYFVGDVKEGDKVVVVEDVTTTGGSLMKTLEALADAKIEVVGVVALVNREEKTDDGKSVEELVSEKGKKYYAMGVAGQLLPLAVEKYKPSDDFLKKFQDNYNQFAITPIKVA
jgi:orotate phosphoribosyltransferase